MHVPKFLMRKISLVETGSERWGFFLVEVALSCLWVFLTEEFNSYVKSKLIGLKCR